MSDNQRWYELGEPEGRGWPAGETKRVTDRLPAKAEGLVPDVVWDLSRHASSLYYRFRTDADRISARWTLPEGGTAMLHLSAAAHSGLDLYAEDDHGNLRWAGWSAPDTGGPAEKELLVDIRPMDQPREYRLYLPLFNQVDDVAVGLAADASFEICERDTSPPIVYYGTSIVHGACASRCGMAMPAQLGRRLQRPVIGLGFSGNGRMEVELAALLAEIDAAVYLVDCLPNMTPEQVAERTVPFVQRLRADRPHTPILLVEDRTLTNAWLRTGVLAAHRDRRTAYREAYRTLAADDANLHHLPYDGLLGTDDEGTVDSSHPTDLGFTRMVDILTPEIQRLL